MSCFERVVMNTKRVKFLLLFIVQVVAISAWSNTETSSNVDSLQMTSVEAITCFRDADGDTYGNPNVSFTNSVAVACPSGWVSNNLDCNDANVNINPNALEICNGLNDDCDGQTDEGFPILDKFADLDGDGFGDPFSIFSGAPTCQILPGFVTNADDCDDFDFNIFPGQVEACNGLDDNCDGVLDEGLPQTTFFFDNDGDNFGDDLNTIDACNAPPFTVNIGGDCDDNDSFNFPGNSEACDLLDNDCDGVIDNGAGQDNDGDGWSTCENDCDDNDPLINPGLVEICNQFDDNCNGGIDEGFDQDFDGFTVCQNDCDELNSTINPSVVEVCDGIDQNCDGVLDDGFDVDADGFTSCSIPIPDCDDASDLIFPGAVEICGNGIDEDCDGADLACVLGCTDVTACNFNALATQDDGSCTFPTAEICANGVDEDCDGIDNPTTTYFLDNDNDGFGDPSNSQDACTQPAGFVTDNTDCNDFDFW